MSCPLDRLFNANTLPELKSKKDFGLNCETAAEAHQLKTIC